MCWGPMILSVHFSMGWLLVLERTISTCSTLTWYLPSGGADPLVVASAVTYGPSRCERSTGAFGSIISFSVPVKSIVSPVGYATWLAAWSWSSCFRKRCMPLAEGAG